MVARAPFEFATLRRVLPSPAVLLRLAEKYQTLGALRRARAEGHAVPERAVFQALAEEFPGCLNELDTLPLDEIDARAAALAAAATGGPILDWMAWLAGYHALLRAALRIRIRSTQRRDVDAARARDLAEDASAHAGAAIDPAFVQAVLRPLGGRIIPVVYERLAALHGAPAATIKRALFPRGRDDR
jgi:hypothetical protein